MKKKYDKIEIEYKNEIEDSLNEINKLLKQYNQGQNILDSLDLDSLEGELFREAKRNFSDAFSIFYEKEMSLGTYSIRDVKNNILAYVWYEKDKRIKVIVNPQVGIIQKRMN